MMAAVTRMESTLLGIIITSFVVLSFLANGKAAGITSTFLRSEYPAVDMPLDHKVFAVPKGYNAPQQVHITQGDYDGKAVIISWVMPDEPGDSKVQYGTSDKKYEFSAKGVVTNYTYYQYKSGYIHHCLVGGLEYDTKYYYEIGNGSSSREFWFTTPPKVDPNSHYTFGIIGDLGQTFNSLSTLEHYMNSAGQAVLYVGDLSYADRYEYNDIGLRWDTWARFVEQSTAYQSWMWSTGNHDIDYRPSMGEITPFKNYLHRYATPYLASNSSNPLWYAIRRASAHIIVLSSYSPFGNCTFLHLQICEQTLSILCQYTLHQLLTSSPVKYTPQYLWLAEELKKVDREKTPWLIVLMHIPMYNSNDAHFKEGESMRAVFESWFVQYKVDVVFAGHVHAYERSYRISNIQYNITSGIWYPIPDKSAPVYVNVGDGGNNEGLAARYRDPQPDYSAFREASYGHSTLELMNRTHALYHWNRNDEGKKTAADAFVLHNQYWQA
ncbi:bifunctional purple acid phosphatase 26-like isoform X1 [Malus sylvestris]|uniref:bifunctional purple acid phosphatase 26-like isoform X1 n=1 Tax=Malus sylvestris TaxID=3752 RepID=UPI0021AC6F0F|nr:bifunctional purple acid phosphatase 26-like isoform X1 [Malus sylvestris]